MHACTPARLRTCKLADFEKSAHLHTCIRAHVHTFNHFGFYAREGVYGDGGSSSCCSCVALVLSRVSSRMKNTPLRCIADLAFSCPFVQRAIRPMDRITTFKNENTGLLTGQRSTLRLDVFYLCVLSNFCHRVGFTLTTNSRTHEL